VLIYSMRRLLCPALLVALAACGSPDRLAEGRWSGTLTPMNHPEMANPIAYDVDYEGDDLRIALVGPNGAALPTLDVRLTADTLYFAFDEPEENVLLRCALAHEETDRFAGRCTDASGKWARFTMLPPE
jgi:hypothetical protein